MRRHGGLAAGVVTLLLGAAAPAVAATPDLDVHLARDTDSALLDELDDELDFDETRAGDADIVVLDGDAFTAGEILRSAKVQSTLNRDAWVLLVDPSRADLAAIADLSGFGSGRRDVAATLLRVRQDARGDQVVVIREWPATISQITPTRPPTPDPDDVEPPATEETRERGSAEDERELAELNAQSLAAVLTRDDKRDRDDRPDRGARAAAAPDVSTLPPEVQHTRVIYTWDDHVNLVRGACKQTVSVHLSTAYDVFLQNSVSSPFGDRQWIAASIDGWSTPRQQDEPWCAVQTADVWNISTLGTADLATGWWTAAVDASLEPRSSAIALQQALPETPNQSTEYTSGTTFKLGFSARAQSGIRARAAQGIAHDDSSFPVEGSVNAEWAVSNTARYTVSNWSVRSQTNANTAAWRFYSRDKCDTESATDLIQVDGCFFISSQAGINSGLPVQPNELSKGQMPFHTSALWRTDRVRRDTVAFQPTARTELLETLCSTFVGGVCAKRWANRVKQPWAMPTQTLDLGDVVPVGVTSLTFAPGDNVPAGTKVTATVTLADPAPTDLSLPVSSDIRNVTVPARVDIKAGDTTGTFTILTRDNALKAGEHETGVVSVFYARTYSEQLTVSRP